MSYNNWIDTRYDGVIRGETSSRIWDLEYIPIYIISQYVWAEALRQDKATLWGIASPTFDDCPFFAKVQTDSTGWYSPTTNPTGPAYVVYDYIFSQTSGTFWPITKEQGKLEIIGETYRINEIKNFVFDLLNRFDTTAERVNEWIANGINTGGVDELVGISFKSIKCVQGSYISDNEGYDYTRNSSSIVLMYEYAKS